MKLPTKGKDIRPIIVAACISCAQGILTSSNTIISFIYKEDYGFDPSTATFVATCVRLPWTIKPVWGILSDSYTLFGYKRKSYLFLTALISFLCLANFGSNTYLPPLALGICLLVFNAVCTSFQSVIGQAIIVENTRKKTTDSSDTSEKQKNKAASNGMSIVQAARILGNVILSTFIMFLFKKEKRHDFIFFICMVPLGLFFVSFLFPEKKKLKKADKLLERKEFQNPLASVASSENEDVPLLREDQNTGNQGVNNTFKAIEFIKNPLIYKCWLLIFLSSFAPTSNDLRIFYYDNYLHFEESFWGVVNNLAFIANIFGIFIYNRYFSNVNLKKFYNVTLIIMFFLHLSMLILYLRYTVKWGISDKLFVAIDTLVVAFTHELHHLPVLVLACRLCPKNIEATVFAIFMAAPNIAMFFSSLTGGILIDILGITKTNFDNIWVFCVVNAVVPLFVLFLIFSIDFDKAFKEVEEFNKKSAETAQNDQEGNLMIQPQNALALPYTAPNSNYNGYPNDPFQGNSKYPVLENPINYPPQNYPNYPPQGYQNYPGFNNPNYYAQGDPNYPGQNYSNYPQAQGYYPGHDNPNHFPQENAGRNQNEMRF